MRSIAIAATTLDGKIALERDHFSDWTSPEDKAFMRKLLDEADVIVVGNNTYKTAEKPLSRRNCIVLTSSIAAVGVNETISSCGIPKEPLILVFCKITE